MRQKIPAGILKLLSVTITFVSRDSADALRVVAAAFETRYLTLMLFKLEIYGCGLLILRFLIISLMHTMATKSTQQNSGFKRFVRQFNGVSKNLLRA